MKTVFFGASEYVLPIVQLLKDGLNLSLIVTTEKEGIIARFAKEYDIPLIVTNKLTELEHKTISETEADLGIVADFGVIIPKLIIDSFPLGIINIHPSLLPKYRGSTPVQTALLNGDKETGVSIIKIDEKMDHGDILSQEEYEILPDDNTDTLLRTLFKISAPLLEDTLNDYLEGVLTPEEQNHNLATFTKMLKKENGFIDIENPPSKEKILNMIRAFYPWPGVFIKAFINSKELIIKLLPEKMIQVEGKKPQNYKDFMNGYKEGEDILGKLKLN